MAFAVSFEAIGINVRDDDFRTFREKTLRRSAPDAARGAGDDRNLIRELQDILLRLFLSWIAWLPAHLWENCSDVPGSAPPAASEFDFSAPG
jgi:hypothetical protein